MGVKWLMRWAKPPTVPVTPQDADVLCMALERLQARRVHRDKDRNNEVLCHMYKQPMLPDRPDLPDSGMRDVWLIQQQDCLASTTLLLHKAHMLLEAEPGMQAMMERCLDYKCKNIIIFSGPRYVLGDFSFKVLTVTHLFGAQERKFLGNVLELEYGPLVDMDMAQQVMADMVNVVGTGLGQVNAVGRLEPMMPSYDKYQGLPQSYGVLHAATAYVLASVTMSVASNKRVQQ